MQPTTQEFPAQADRQSPRVGWCLVLLAAALWGTTGLMFKALDSANQTNALSISFLRLALSVPFILVGARLLLGRVRVRLTARGAVTLASVGAGMALYQVTYVLAIERVGVAIAVLISICGAPVILALISALFFGERFHRRIVLALIASVAGTVLLVGFPDTAAPAAERFWEGVAIAVACAVFQAFFVLTSRAAGAVAHPLESVGIGFAMGAVMLLPFAAYNGLALEYTTEGWLMLVYIGVVPTAIAQTLFMMGLKSTGAVGGAVASLLEPLVTTVLAVLILGEQIGLIGYIGAVVLLGGIALAQWEPRGKVDSESGQEPSERRPTVGAVRADWRARLPGWLQPFLTWLIGYPYAGQKPLFQNKPWWLAVLVPCTVLVLGLALSVVLVNAGGYALLALPIAWLLALNGGRTLQAVVCHHGIHGNLTGDPTKDRAIVEAVSTLLLVQGHDGYKHDHDGVHHPRLAAAEDPDRQFTIEVMKIAPGADRTVNKRRFVAALLSPKLHALFLVGRLKANFVNCPPLRRLLSLAWLAIVVATLVASQRWVEFLVGCVIPLAVLYHMSAMCQFVTEHFWARQRRPGQAARDHYLALLVNRHLGDPLPQAEQRGLAWWSAWMTWWVRLVLYHVPVRLGILVADLPVHGSHHLWPHDKHWADGIYSCRELADQAGKSPLEFLGSYGELLDYMLESFSEVPSASCESRPTPMTFLQAASVTHGM